MTTLLIAIGSFFGFILAYHTYGRWIAHRIFGIDPDAVVPSEQLRDNIDFVPTKKEVIFGHHFTSIAGTGPIVGPAIAVFWGWLPALLWVVFGSIFIGAVHDFGALIVSLRNRGQTVGEIAGRIISPRAKVLFLVVLAMALTVVLAIFGLVIAIIFAIYPQSVLSVWIEIPLAIAIGYWVYRRGGGLLVPSILALAVMYLAIYIGVYYLQISLGDIPGVAKTLADAGAANPYASGVVIWTCILLVYCFVASVLPVWVLLQPRDFINSHQLVLALSLLILGLVAAGVSGQAQINSAPAIAQDIPPDAPPIMPFLFITIACGAVSGFHCLVSSGTSSKQIASESDAQYVGYGAMLLEGALAVIVILACCAGVGMGVTDESTGTFLTGQEAWRSKYQAHIAQKLDADGSPMLKNGKPHMVGGWGNHGLEQKVQAFIEGGANFLNALKIPLDLGIGIIAVLVASFAATTLDTATRLQRYVLQELGGTLHIKPLTNKFVATGFAVVVAGAVALLAGSKPGAGGMMLWPLFGATNQLLAGLALMVTVFYLWRRNKPVWFALLPMLLMVAMPAWALSWQLFNTKTGWWYADNTLLICFGLGTLGLQAWMVVEALIAWPKARGVLEEALPPLEQKNMGGGRSC